MMFSMHTSMFTESCSHEFIPSKEGQSRAPCPALNALANHGYISRDGRNLTIPELVGALQRVYNLSFALAMILSLVAVIRCGRGLKLDLNDLAKHNVIEHDASLIHDDCQKGQDYACTFPNRNLLQRLVQYAAKGHGLSLKDFSRARVDRESGFKCPLDILRSQVTVGESALTWLVMKDQHNEVPTELVKEWYGEERIPHGWAPPAKPVGLFSTHGVASMIAKKMK